MPKTLIILVVFSTALVGCQKFFQPVTNVRESITQKVEEEQEKQGNKSLAIINCRELCQEIMSSDGQDFEVGPCLSNEIAPDWVCDVAHSPRQAVDNNPANQCLAFREGKASHFVEVDGNCNLIRAN